MTFLLSVDRGYPGGTKITYDIGVTERAQVLVPETSVHHVLDMDPNDLIGLSLMDSRPPARTRSRGNGAHSG